MWYLYTMEFYAAMKKNEMLSFAGKWMELENIILSEVRQAQKTKTHKFSLIWVHLIKGKHNTHIHTPDSSPPSSTYHCSQIYITSHKFRQHPYLQVPVSLSILRHLNMHSYFFQKLTLKHHK
jgi:hypothetical protein